MCACVVLLVHMAYTASIHPSSCCACVVVIAHVSQVSANGDLHQDDDLRAARRGGDTHKPGGATCCPTNAMRCDSNNKLSLK